MTGKNKKSKAKRMIKNSKSAKKKKTSKKRCALQMFQQISMNVSELHFSGNLKSPDFQKKIANELADRWQTMSAEEKQEWFRYGSFSDDVRKVASMAAKTLFEDTTKKYDPLKFKAAAELYSVARDSKASAEVIKTQGDIIQKTFPSPIAEQPATAAEALREKLKKAKLIKKVNEQYEEIERAERAAEDKK